MKYSVTKDVMIKWKRDENIVRDQAWRRKNGFDGK